MHIPYPLIIIGLLVAFTVASWFNNAGRRLRDPRLDRDYSDDEPAPYDDPACKSLNPRMNSYMRMIDPDQDRPRY
ncbi:MAG: hypothetical protein JO165_13025 [Candidatus Eremiobacteraeota bacterium]|nr:hypothetical protein [Candidatus Eremiobacteraeota bacterium]